VKKDIAIFSDFSGEVDSSLTYCPLIKTGIYLGSGHMSSVARSGHVWPLSAVANFNPHRKAFYRFRYSEDQAVLKRDDLHNGLGCSQVWTSKSQFILTLSDP